MKARDIRVGLVYVAKVNGIVRNVQVVSIDEVFYLGKSRTRYTVKNLATGRITTFRSASKFRGEVMWR